MRERVATRAWPSRRARRAAGSDAATARRRRPARSPSPARCPEPAARARQPTARARRSVTTAAARARSAGAPAPRPGRRQPERGATRAAAERARKCAGQPRRTAGPRSSPRDTADPTVVAARADAAPCADQSSTRAPAPRDARRRAAPQRAQRAPSDRPPSYSTLRQGSGTGSAPAQRRLPPTGRRCARQSAGRNDRLRCRRRSSARKRHSSPGSRASVASTTGAAGPPASRSRTRTAPASHRAARALDFQAAICAVRTPRRCPPLRAQEYARVSRARRRCAMHQRLRPRTRARRRSKFQRARPRRQQVLVDRCPDRRAAQLALVAGSVASARANRSRASAPRRCPAHQRSPRRKPYASRPSASRVHAAFGSSSSADVDPHRCTRRWRSRMRHELHAIPSARIAARARTAPKMGDTQPPAVDLRQ